MIYKSLKEYTIEMIKSEQNPHKKDIAILGCGRLMEPIAESLRKTYSLNVSTTSQQKLKALTRSGMVAYQINLEDGKLQDLSLFLQAEQLIISIPPSSKEASKPAHLSQISHLLDLLTKYQFQGRIYYCSSTSVYGNQTGLLDEESTTHPQTNNAKQIDQIEKKLNQSHLKTTILRLGGLYEKHRHPANYLSDRPLVNSPYQNVNLIHHDEVKQILTKLIERQEDKKTLPQHETFNLTNDIHLPKWQFYSLASKLLNILPPRLEQDLDAQIESEKIICNLKIKKELNYSFDISWII